MLKCVIATLITLTVISSTVAGDRFPNQTSVANQQHPIRSPVDTTTGKEHSPDAVPHQATPHDSTMVREEQQDGWNLPKK